MWQYNIIIHWPAKPETNWEGELVCAPPAAEGNGDNRKVGRGSRAASGNFRPGGGAGSRLKGGEMMQMLTVNHNISLG